MQEDSKTPTKIQNTPATTPTTTTTGLRLRSHISSGSCNNPPTTILVIPKCTHFVLPSESLYSG
jgi:hypothetical protein